MLVSLLGQTNLDDSRQPIFPKSSNLCLSEGVSLPAIRANDKPFVLNLQQPVRKIMGGEKYLQPSHLSLRDVGAV